METNLNNQRGEVIQLHGRGPGPDAGPEMSLAETQRHELMTENCIRNFLAQLVVYGNAPKPRLAAVQLGDMAPTNVVSFPSGRCRL